ncbi:MAG: acyl-CoA/acyl-ACP dehydrogenase [Chloroflexi bacterium]|nr:acyl-CoA/acyl-ACP dehydrogenase [Chloroflexota bacterium]
MDFTLSEELTMIRDMARDFVTNELLPIESQVLVLDGQPRKRGAPIPREKYDALKKKAIDQGLWAMTAPEALGGGGLSTLGACLVAEELGKTFVAFDFGDIPPILFDANTEQIERYLKPAIAGQLQVALALHEAHGDEIETRAMLDGDAWVLNGTKLVEEANVYLVFARADEGATCFIIDDVKSQDGKLILRDARVSALKVLGEVGKAFALGKPYQNARWIRAAARKVGIAARLLEMSSVYTRDWKALGQALSVRPAVQRALADTAIEITAARWLVYQAACEFDEGKDARESAPRAYLFAAEMVQRTIERTIEIYGGPAHAPDWPMMRIYSADKQSHEEILQVQRIQVANSLLSQP